ncbi:hypothetical protein RJ55_06529 [Drechmeria coniospora]|nr:hypothetical protein RJ55_06529 [Drechmeria coniospora]
MNALGLSSTCRRPPSVSVVVLLALQLAAGNAIPRETGAVEWPRTAPCPSPTPTWTHKLGRRALSNTVCGYIGGDPALPATCREGSYCAVDVRHGAVGCCPDGGACTTGIFTGCVDGNSGPQTVRNPYLYTCAGGDVCYKNNFDGGFFQYGCGTASNLATNVATAAPGRPPLRLSYITLSFTAAATSTAPSTTGGSSDSAVKSDSGLQSTPLSPPASATDEPTAPDKDGGSVNTAVIVGGIVGGIVLLAALFALAALFMRRRKQNARNGPGSSQDTSYISPMAQPGHNFLPLQSSYQAQEADTRQQGPLEYGHGLGASRSHDDASRWQAHLHHKPLPQVGVESTNRYQGPDPDCVPLTREAYDFPGAYNAPMPDVRDDMHQRANMDDMGTHPASRRKRTVEGILWQQNRRNTRNVSWL